MYTTQTNGNSVNRIHGSRLRVWTGRRGDANPTLVGQVIVPHASARYYIQMHPGGKYAAQYRRLLDQCALIEAGETA